MKIRLLSRVCAFHFARHEQTVEVTVRDVRAAAHSPYPLYMVFLSLLYIKPFHQLGAGVTGVHTVCLRCDLWASPPPLVRDLRGSLRNCHEGDFFLEGGD